MNETAPKPDTDIEQGEIGVRVAMVEMQWNS
jgi:hypothetical protein